MKRILFLFAVVLVASSAFAQHLTWTWSQGDPTKNGPATSFIVERSATTGGPYVAICGGTGQLACPLVTQPFAYFDSVATQGNTYFYVVQATGPGGGSALSNEVKAVIPFLPPAAPSGLQSQ